MAVKPHSGLLDMDSKVALACWPISRTIGRDLERKVKLLRVFNSGKSAIFTTVDGEVYGVGANPNGVLGTGSALATTTPTKIDGLTGATHIAAGNSKHLFVIALTADGSLYAWGHHGHGNLGLRNTTSPVLVPTLIQHNITGIKITKVACGQYHALALSDEGQVFSWGGNAQGQLGNGTTSNSDIPNKVTGELEKCKCSEICGGDSSSYALTKEGKLYSWGFNAHGQLGIGSTNNSAHPRLVRLETVIILVCAGPHHVLAVDDKGHLFSWGLNNKGQLGNGTSAQSNIPIHHAKIRVADVAAHYTQNLSAAVTDSGKVLVWGETSLQNNPTSPMETMLQSLDEVFCVYGNGTMYRTLKFDGDDENQSVSDTVKYQFNNKETADFEFVFGDSTIYAHKQILSMRSDYYKNLFGGQWKESSEHMVKVSDFSYDVFYAFIQYLYTDEVDIKPADADSLLALSEQYMVWGLKKKVEHLMRNALSADNVATSYSVAKQYKAESLRESCVKFAAGSMKEVMTSGDFEELPGDVAKSFVMDLSKLDVYKT